jgi:UDP-N-acetylmuramoyl-L-alanyl-D-glutamate--2,6-diaminopimelate ligase
LRIVDIRPEGSRQHVTLEIFGRQIEIDFPLAGEFQAANALIAAGLAIAVGEDVDAVLDALQHLEGVPGRLQLAGRTRDGASIYIDYAHTPDALSTVLTALRPHVTARLSVIFGCGGDRDAKKRPVMGDIAVRMADTVIVTDDNPRYEDPVAIRAQILAAADGALEIGDRREAIRTGIAQLAPGDVLVLAGKGHEKGQIIGDAVVPFDDFNEVREALSDLGRL